MRRRVILSGLFGMTLIAGARATTFTRVPAPPVDDLLAVWGMNVRLEYTDGSYDGTFPVNGKPAVQNDIADLLYLGSNGPAFRSVRDMLPNDNAGTPMSGVYGQQLAAIQQFVNAGIGFTFETGSQQTTDAPSQSVGQTMAQLDLVASYALPQANRNASQPPPALKYIEGPNEVGSSYSFGGQTGNAAAIAWGKQLYQAKVASPMAHVYMTDFTTQDAPGTCVIGYYADEANNHPYSNDGFPPGLTMRQEFASSYGNVPGNCPYGLPKSVTEDGYPAPDDTEPNNYGSNAQDINHREVGLDAQMQYLLDLGMDAYAEGLREIDFYQLLAAYPDPNGNNEDAEFGWFNYDGTPKPVAAAFHTWTGLLADSSAYRRTTHSLSYNVSNPPPAGGTEILSTYDGSKYFVIVWGEYKLWDPNTETEHDPAGVDTALTLPSAATSITLYDPTDTGSPAQASCTDCTTLSGRFGSHPEVFVIRP